MLNIVSSRCLSTFWCAINLLQFPSSLQPVIKHSLTQLHFPPSKHFQAATNTLIHFNDLFLFGSTLRLHTRSHRVESTEPASECDGCKQKNLLLAISSLVFTSSNASTSTQVPYGVLLKLLVFQQRIWDRKHVT